ncbi:MAG: pentapeptide repeat-containing protein [Microcystis sp. LE19-338.1B]|nr:pentapeptide repeat-containing protein [Microcystis sp. LE19-338.1B]MCZ8357600.1 pentapeptide repeat-containing protein [Microcystis sp. LE19-388.1G]
MTNYLNIWQSLSKIGTETARVEQLKSLVSVGSSFLVFFGAVGSIYWTYRNIKASLEKQITDRFTAAINQLKSDEPAVQLGGIYALETISKESEQYYWTIMEILTSLIKYESSKFEKKMEEENNNKKKNLTLLIFKHQTLEEEIEHKIPIVIQAALNVIGRRDTSRDYWERERMLDLRHCYLCKANLKGAKLKNADLSFSNLNSAELQEADLSGAYLERAKLKGANFKYANLDKAFFQDAILQEADLTGCSTIDTNFTRADLSSADLTNTNLKLANLSEAMLISIKGFGRNVDFYTSLDGATYDDDTEREILRSVKPNQFDFDAKGMKKIKSIKNK